MPSQQQRIAELEGEIEKLKEGITLHSVRGSTPNGRYCSGTWKLSSSGLGNSTFPPVRTSRRT